MWLIPILYFTMGMYLILEHMDEIVPLGKIMGSLVFILYLLTGPFLQIAGIITTLIDLISSNDDDEPP